MPQRRITKQPTGFTQVTNQVLNDKNLTWKAKGIYAYIYSKPDGWDFSARRIALDAKDGRDGTISGIKELEKAGYIFREKHKDGRVTYHILVDIHTKPVTEMPEQATMPVTENPKYVKPVRRETRTISNKEHIVIKNTSNTTGEPVGGTLVAELIKAMEAVDPKNKTYYGNKTQRAAASFLIEEYGLEETLKRISILPQTNKIAYWPTITTPCQLRDKWVQLEDAAARAKQKQGATAANVAF